jgi:hypothetical protein
MQSAWRRIVLAVSSSRGGCVGGQRGRMRERNKEWTTMMKGYGEKASHVNRVRSAIMVQLRRFD